MVLAFLIATELMDGFDETDHMRGAVYKPGHPGAPPLGGEPGIHNPQTRGYGFRARGHPSTNAQEPAPRNDAGYDSNFKNALLVQLYTDSILLFPISMNDALHSNRGGKP